MEFLLLRKPKPPPTKPEQEITFTGINNWNEIEIPRSSRGHLSLNEDAKFMKIGQVYTQSHRP